MNVLSLFDGISCGRVALERAGCKVSSYYASEVDKHAIKATQTNYPDTVQLGDVNHINNFPSVDLLIGGSPCQGFSFAGKGLNFEDPRSKLFFEFVRVLEETKPKFFLMENTMMIQKSRDIISSYLGVQPVMIDSSLVSAQTRKRLYWANFPIEQPIDKQIEIGDILNESTLYPVQRPAAIRGRKIDKYGNMRNLPKDHPTIQCLEVSNGNKMHCLTTLDKNTIVTWLPPGRYVDAYNINYPYRPLNRIERLKLMGLPVGYLRTMTRNQMVKATGNAWQVDTVAHIFSHIK